MTKSRRTPFPTGNRRHGRRCVRGTRRPSQPGRRSTDAFFRHIVAGMRNGVLAITRDGAPGAHQRRGVPHLRRRRRSPTTSVSRSPTVLRDHPDVVRVLTGAFDLHHLPNRVELRLQAVEQGDRLHARARPRRRRRR